jgi:hypothetical protein
MMIAAAMAITEQNTAAVMVIRRFQASTSTHEAMSPPTNHSARNGVDGRSRPYPPQAIAAIASISSATIPRLILRAQTGRAFGKST